MNQHEHGTVAKDNTPATHFPQVERSFAPLIFTSFGYKHLLMTLDEKQRTTVAAWIAEGLKMGDIQNRLEAEFQIRMTYLDVRLLVDDLRLTPKDPEIAAPSPLTQDAPAPAAAGKSETKPVDAPSPGGISVNVDAVTRPGALVSGKVNFSDGQRADWYLDQMGRLGLVPQQQGYRPSQADIQSFQAELQNQLARMGY